MSPHDELTVRTVGPDEVGDVVSVLSESFFDYPVMRHVLGEGGDYRARLDDLITLFTMTRVLRHQAILGIGPRRSLSGVALVSYPGGDARPSPAKLEAVRSQTWLRLGADARSRYEQFVQASAPFHVEEGHHYLGMIGVRGSLQGRGLGRALLERVHDLSAADPASIGVALSTEVEANVALYRHFGYEVIGSGPVGGAFTTWSMLRRDDG